MASILRKNLMKLFGSNAIIKPIWFLYMYAVIRVLGKEDFGSFTILLAFVTIATQLLDAGLVNKTYVLLNDRKFEGFFGETPTHQLLIHFKVFLGFGASLILVSFLYIIDYESKVIILYACIIFIGIYITQQYRVIFRSFELFTLEALSVLLERLIVILFTIDLFYSSYSFETYSKRYALAYLVFLIIISYTFEKKIGHNIIRYKIDDFYLLVKQAGSLYVNNIILSIRQRLPFFILEKIGGRAIVGVYSSAYRFVESYMFLPNSTVQVTYAQFSKKASSSADFAKDIWKSHKLIFFPTLAIMSIAIILMPYVINLLLGNEFLEYVIEYRIAMLIFLPNGSYYLLTSLSNIFHIQHKVNYLYIFNFTTLLVTQFVFYHLMGLKGSLLSMLLSEYIMVFEYHFALRDKVNLTKSRYVDAISAIFSLSIALWLIFGFSN